MNSIRCLFKQPFLVLSILLAVSVIGFSFGIAQAQSQTPGIKTDRAVYPEPSLAIPRSAGDKFNDPVFGTEIMRATDGSDCAAPGCGTFYSQWPTFNSDNTRIMIRKGETGDVIIKSFDPVSFKLGPTLRTSPLLPGGTSAQWQGATWSRTDPDLIFIHAGYYSPDYSASGMKLYTYRPSTNVFTLLKDFAPQLAPGQPDYLFEMHIAQDGKDDLFTFMQNTVGNPENPLYFIVWRRSTDTVLQHISNDASFDANAALPDKSGRWIFFPLNKTQADLSRHRTLDLQTNTWQVTYWTSSDDAPSHGDVGTGTLTGFGNFTGGFTLRPLGNVHSSAVLFDNKDAAGVKDWTNDQHTTLYADDESWATLGLYDDPGIQGVPETGAFENEVMRIAMDGSQRIRRLFHHRSHIDNLSETSGYWAVPKPTISRDGRFIAFTSNWGNGGRYDLFIARIDPSDSVPTPSPTPVSTPTPTSAPSSEVIWVDDRLPANAVPGTNNDSWNWMSSNPSPYSGVVANQSRIAAGLHQQNFSGASETLEVNVGDVLIAYVFIDPNTPPSEVMLQWKENTQGWEHRAYWGANEIEWGAENTSGRRRIGVLPRAGAWVRLEVPASLVGLEGKTINGMAFTLYGGSATWDRAGKLTKSSSVPTPTPSPTPSSSPTPSPTPTSTPQPPPLSLGMVSSVLAMASTMGTSSSTTAAHIEPLVTNINRAYAMFLSEQDRFSSDGEIDRELRASLYFAQGAEALARMNNPNPGIQNRLQVVAYYLSRAKNTMSGETTGELNSLLFQDSLAFSGTPVIGPAEALSTASFSPVLAPTSLGTVLGDPNQSPLSTLTTYAALSTAGELPYELSGVSVSVGGRAVRLISVSPSRIYFSIPADAPLGDTEVIVTSQEGYVSRGMTRIAALAPGIFTLSGNGMGDAVVLNATTLKSGPFNITTLENFGADKQTRLLIFASGLGNGFLNTNVGNDIAVGSTFFSNIAESVVVEARTVDNRVFQLRVEFIGPAGRSYGLDQINICLVNELKGAGTVELTMVVAGHRSNMARIEIN
jgi:uncharacterized protein (TIGR03437 family)